MDTPAKMIPNLSLPGYQVRFLHKSQSSPSPTPPVPGLAPQSGAGKRGTYLSTLSPCGRARVRGLMDFCKSLIYNNIINSVNQVNFQKEEIMEEQEQKQKKPGEKTKVDIETDIVNRFSKVKETCDSCIALINKEGKSPSLDITQTDDLIYQMQDELDEIRDLLFDMEESEESNEQ
jgi:predicted house-cleaning noncanonical NTP pyrophosphatase (MazG superfamily)